MAARPSRGRSRGSNGNPRRGGGRARTRHFSFADPLVKFLVAGFLVIGLLFVVVFGYYYVKYERIVDKRMAGGVFSNAAKIYSRPRLLSIGDKLDAAEVAAELRRAGYTEGDHDGSSIGHYRFVGGGIEIVPGPQSFHAAEGARLRFDNGKLKSITVPSLNQSQPIKRNEPACIAQPSLGRVFADVAVASQDLYA